MRLTCYMMYEFLHVWNQVLNFQTNKIFFNKTTSIKFFCVHLCMRSCHLQYHNFKIKPGHFLKRLLQICKQTFLIWCAAINSSTTRFILSSIIYLLFSRCWQSICNNFLAAQFIQAIDNECNNHLTRTEFTHRKNWLETQLTTKVVILLTSQTSEQPSPRNVGPSTGLWSWRLSFNLPSTQTVLVALVLPPLPFSVHRQPLAQ